jgi:hypothetical protein
MNTTAILEALEAERDRITTAIEALQPTTKGRRRSASATAGKRRHMSAAARRRISLAQKRRWAEHKKKS